MPTFIRRTLCAASLAVALALPSSPTISAEVAGVHFDDKTTLAGSDLVLSGAGLRTRFMLKVYAMGLYLPRQAANAEAATNQSGPKRIQIVTLRNLTAEQFADALVEGLKKNLTEAEFAKLQSRAEELRNNLLAVKSASAGTQIRLEWIPTAGTRLSIGNEVRGKDIPGEDFYRALLRIWLGDSPADSDLKGALLGKS